MEFVDNTGHIFSIKSYNEKPIGYEYEETNYIFWIDANTSKLSINNYYSRPIYALYLLDKDYNINDLQDDENSPIQISIEIENSNVYKLISSKEFNSYILSNEYTNLNDYIDLGNADDSQYLKSSLSNKDLYVIKTTETVSNTKTLQSVDFNYLLIPIYPIGCATEEGTWISNIMIHIHDTNTNVHEWCPISIGGEFINEYEELIINGKNIGVSLPKDILKAVYPESLYNDEFNESLYNEKLKEYLINKNIIRSECGNFNSAIASLKWFGYGDKISISKLLKTDNTSMSQYLLDYFNVKNDIIDSFKSFTSSALISLKLMLNKELNEVYPFNPNLNYEFFGENKPKMLSLLDHYEKVKIGNHDMPIDEDVEKYWYWKPYFDFSFNELGIKLALLKKFYKQYFLPIHLYIHNASLGYKVYANDIKYTITTGVSMSEPIISLNIKDNEVKFSNDSTYYFSKQIHYIDHNFNEFDLNDIEHDNRSWYYLNDTCVNIPIEFISNERNKGYFNCVFILLNKNISHEPLFESHFIFTQADQYVYKNFIIYPKKLNINVRDKISDDSNISITSKYYEYWINDDFELKLLVNNRWYEHKFNLKIHNPTLDFGTLRYRYYLNEHNYLLNRISSNTSNIHSLIFTNELDQINKSTDINISNLIDYNDSLFNLLNLDDSKSFIKTLDISDIDNLWQHFDSNYDILSPFTQLNRLDHDNKVVSFNSFMHNCELVNVNNIDYDIDFYKILKYHLDKNLMYIDGTLLNQDFYQYIIYPYNGKDVEVLIHKDMIGYPIEIPLQYFNKDKLVICSHNGNIYILEEASENSDSYHINVMNSNNSIIVSEDEQANEYALLLDSLSLEYDKINNAYYSKDPITGEINGYYPIYDKLYNNLDYIYEKYSSNINLPNLDKYKNSLHLFNIYTLDKHEQNILVFHNDINILINGLIFTHNSYDYENEYDSLKIHISGKPNKDNISTQYLDVYGLHLIEPYIENGQILNIPEEIKLYNYEYGLYVKRDYSLYYDSEGSDETRPEIYELPNIFEYDTNEFTYYDDNRKYLGSLKFKTLDDFYNDNRIDECIDIDGTWYIYGINTELSSNYADKPFLRDGKWYAINKETNEEINININEIFKEDSVYYAYDTEIKDLSNLDNYYKNKLAYKIKFYGNNDILLTGVSLNNIYEIEYKYLKIELFYNSKHIVRNRFYLLIDYMVEYIEQGYSFEFVDETHIRMYKDDESYDIELIKLSPKYLYKNADDSYIPNQNPAYYWYNVDNNSITSLSSYLNELERYIYNGKEQTLDSIISQLDMYVEKFEHNKNIDNVDDYVDDSIEARYHYYNYLSKDFTGKKGTYRLKLESNFITDFTVRLKLDVIDANGYKTTYTNLDGEFTLIGNEQSVILYIQLSDLEDIENIDNWIVPQLLEITTIDKQLEYNYEESGDDYILAHILNKNYYYGNNKSENVYNLYNDFFDLKFNIYDAYVENDNFLICTLLNSVYDVNDELKLHMYLDYDFYLMHDDKYWYGLYISRETCDKVQKHSDLILPEENKIMSLNSKTSDTIYKLKYQASSKEYLINRLEFISSNGFNHFKDDDIIACYINNNDRLPFNPYISSKWSISPMSLGMSDDSKFESNAEMTILSMPKNNNKYQKGYYKATVKYSLDRDIQHQFKNISTFLIS